MKALPFVVSSAMVMAACGNVPPDVTSGEAPDAGECTCKTTFVSAGTATLYARSSYADPDAGYENAVISFKYGSTDESVTNNWWDLLFGNDANSDVDLLTVNTVVGDHSYIVDLGETALRDVPTTVAAPGIASPYCDATDDDIAATLGHLYYVRTLRGDGTRQVAVFGITAHALNDSIDISWFRSADPDTFVLSAP